MSAGPGVLPAVPNLAVLQGEHVLRTAQGL